MTTLDESGSTHSSRAIYVAALQLLTMAIAVTAILVDRSDFDPIAGIIIHGTLVGQCIFAIGIHVLSTLPTSLRLLIWALTMCGIILTIEDVDFLGRGRGVQAENAVGIALLTCGMLTVSTLVFTCCKRAFQVYVVIPGCPKVLSGSFQRFSLADLLVTIALEALTQPDF